MYFIIPATQRLNRYFNFVQPKIYVIDAKWGVADLTKYTYIVAYIPNQQTSTYIHSSVHLFQR